MAVTTSQFVADSLVLSANGSGQIKIKLDEDVKIVGFSAVSSGRCKITNIEQVGVDDYLEGIMEVDNLKQRGNYFQLSQPIPLKAGKYLIFSLTDISGAQNIVTIAIEITPLK